MKKRNLLRTSPIPYILRLLSPGFGYCECCGLPWNFCETKAVYYSETSGTFSTCDVCWNNSTLDELKKYYTNVYNKQKEQIINAGYKMDHTLTHLLDCVTKEYYSDKFLKEITNDNN